MTCCGKERSTRFCPECGMKLTRGNVLLAMLDHCRVNETKQRSRAEFNAKWIGRPHEELPYRHRQRSHDYPRERDEALRSAEKWKAWGDALAALIDGHATEGPSDA